MPHWSIRLLGTLQFERDGKTFKPRTIHQGLLIARLCACHPMPVLRLETAGMLWPLAPRTNAFAYLRRAVMELRRVGFPILSRGEELSVDAEKIVCDLIALRKAEGWADLPPDGAEALEGIEHPIAGEVRFAFEAVRHQLSASGFLKDKPSTDLPAQNEALGRLGSHTVEAHPEIAIEFLADHPDLFTKSALQDSLLDLARKLTAPDSPQTDASLRLRIMAAKVARQRTKYRLAERWLSQALPLCRERRLFGDLAELYGEYSFLEMERRAWGDARTYSELAVEAALEYGDAETLSTAYSSLGRTQWQVRAYEESAQNLLLAYHHTKVHQRRVAILANLSYLWGVLQVPFDLPEAEPLGEGDGFYEAGANSYRQFATHFGRKEFRAAAKSAAITIEITAKNDMDRLFCVALDCAALAFASLDQNLEAAACVRISSRLRNQIGHPRAPMEKDSIRMHVPGPFIGSHIAQVENRLFSDDLAITAAQVSRRLRTMEPAGS